MANDGTGESANLPEFKKPPVVEVAASIQFATVEGLNAARLGLFWSTIRSEYPKTEQHPVLPPAMEAYGAPSPRNVLVTAEPTSPPGRLWFMNAAGTQLLQVQHDRFIVNWRKLDSEEHYPRYPQLRERLVREFSRFETFVLKEGLQNPAANQVELTYVNHVAAGVPQGPRMPPERVVTFWRDGQLASDRPPVEEIFVQFRSVMRDTADVPVGRLYISLESRYRVTDSAPVYVLQLMSRGAPADPGNEGVIASFDRAREWIVKCFAAITTPEMHRLWERTR